MTRTTYVHKNGVLVPRRQMVLGAAAAAAWSLGFPALAKSKPLDGVTLNASLFSTAYSKLLRPWIAEFEEATGARVNFDTPGFPVYNQRADLELSTKGSAYDVVNVTFIYSSRWIDSGWLEPLDDYIANASLTPADFDLKDFMAGALQPERGRDGKLYGIPWLAEVTLAAAGRFDLLQQAGLPFPDTLEQFQAAAKAVNGKNGVAGFVADNHYGWTFPPFLHAFGGDVFRSAPHDLFPTLDTPEAIAAADYFAGLIKNTGPDGAVTYSADQSLQSVKSGRTNLTVQGQVYLSQLADAKTSKVARTAAWGQVPRGKKGRFPGTAIHGWGIPVGSKNKRAAWQFITWAASKATFLRAVEAGYGSPPRHSAIQSPAYAQRQRANGYDIGKLASEAVELAAKQGHMKYRTVAVYPQVDQQLNKAIELIASGQLSAEQAMRQAQAASLAELRRAGAAV